MDTAGADAMTDQPETEAGRALTAGHVFVGNRDPDGSYETGDGACAYCAEDWPCPTSRLVPSIEAEARAAERQRCERSAANWSSKSIRRLARTILEAPEPRPATLDVGRLAEALHRSPGIVTSGWGFTPEEHLAECREIAPIVAAQYAALAATEQE